MLRTLRRWNLHSIMSQNHNSDPVNCLESTVAEFHLRWRHMVESMRYLLNAAQMVEEQRGSGQQGFQQSLPLNLLLYPPKPRPRHCTPKPQSQPRIPGISGPRASWDCPVILSRIGVVPF
ncbi:hypothetical protein C8J56DRAFT_135287 [Mycena floridula]|nr:hypothetical protein C8J56DRAFT_135287 [Mycena floridula]